GMDAGHRGRKRMKVRRYPGEDRIGFGRDQGRDGTVVRRTRIQDHGGSPGILELAPVRRVGKEGDGVAVGTPEGRHTLHDRIRVAPERTAMAHRQFTESQCQSVLPTAWGPPETTGAGT